MDWRQVAKRAEGLHTAESLAKALGIRRNTAILYLHRMRKKGFVKTLRGKRGKRLYDIAPLQLRPVGNEGFIEILNRNTSMQIMEAYVHRIYGKQLSLEEVIIWCMSSGDYRLVLASLELFRKAENWELLYSLARKASIERHVGALYMLIRRYWRMKHPNESVLRKLMKAKGNRKYLIPQMRSRDFKDLEKEWNVFIPFNKADMDRIGA